MVAFGAKMIDRTRKCLKAHEVAIGGIIFNIPVFMFMIMRIIPIIIVIIMVVLISSQAFILAF